MMRLMFWSAATILLAVISHIATILFSQLAPQSAAITQIAQDRPANQLVQISPVGANSMFLPQVSPDIFYVYCAFDIASRPLRIRAKIPSTYWSLAAYTRTGLNFYTINDRQVESKRLEIVVATKQHKDQLEEGTVVVTPPTKTGLILFRTFVPDRSLVEVVQAQMKETSCTSL